MATPTASATAIPAAEADGSVDARPLSTVLLGPVSGCLSPVSCELSDPSPARLQLRPW